jgi:hypothetical protein
MTNLRKLETQKNGKIEMKKDSLKPGTKYVNLIKAAFDKTFQKVVHQKGKASDFPTWLFKLYNDFSRILQKGNFGNPENFKTISDIGKQLYLDVFVFLGADEAANLFKNTYFNSKKVA